MASSTPPRPEPVTKAGAIAGAVSALIVIAGGIARGLGWISDDADVTQVADRTSNLILGAAMLWSILAPFALNMWARAKVTPLASPVDAFGRVLQAVEDAGPTIGQLWDYLEEVLQPAAVIPAASAPPAPTTVLPAAPAAAAVDPDPPTTEIPVVVPPPSAVPVVESTPIGDAAEALSTTSTIPAVMAANPNMAG